MTSISIIGSLARGSSDEFSDRDLLVVSDNVLRSAIVKRYSKKGWNVSEFSTRAFKRLADLQSLFVLHVKQDGRLLSDHDGFLASIFSSYRAKVSYSRESEDSFHSAMQIPELTGEYWFDLCAMDALYVFTRNALILRYASGGRVTYDFSALVTLASLEADIDLSSLNRLRVLKSAYRSRAPCAISENECYRLHSLVIMMIHRFYGELLRPFESFGLSKDYLNLRLIELSTLRGTTAIKLDALDKGDQRYPIWQRISGSTGYPRPRLIH